MIIFSFTGETNWPIKSLENGGCFEIAGVTAKIEFKTWSTTHEKSNFSLVIKIRY